MRIRLHTFHIVVVLFCAAASIRATTLARLSLDQLSAAANAVARLRCTSAESRWENGEIWTVTSFDVLEAMKGPLPARITVRLPGGRVGHLIATVDGTPKFTRGDEAVVFLERSRAGGYSVTAWVQGTFRIARDPRTGHEFVSQDSSAFAVFDTTTRAFRIEGIRRMPIEQFRERITAALTRGPEKSR
jgi:hypothetical protein